MFSHKRHLQDTFDSQHNTKRRLVDHLNGLSIGINYHNNNNNNNNNNKPSVFGNFTKEQLNKPLNDPNKVIIKNIDQFLHENPDQLDLIGEKINLDDLRKAGLDNLVISCGLDLKKAWNTIISRYKSNDNKDNKEDKNLDDLIYKLVWEEYLAKYFSLIKFYDPLKIVWDNYITWLNKKKLHNMKSSNIIELDNDGDEMMFDNNNNNNNNNNNELSPRTQSLHDGTSSYGSYYTHDEHWNDISSNSNSNYNSNYNPNYQNQSYNQHLNPDSMIEDVDDDDVEMMEY